MRKEPLAAKITGYCCSDHFDMSLDVKNYMFVGVGYPKQLLTNKLIGPYKIRARDRLLYTTIY
ncbi:hypothetical protein WDU94_010721 [Cyamophila willieti]